MKYKLETPRDVHRVVKQAIKCTDLMIEYSSDVTCPSTATLDLQDARNHLALSEMLLQQAVLKWKSAPRRRKASSAAAGK